MAADNANPPADADPPLLGVALVSFAVLVLQVALTRVFSLLIWYHFAFLAIALALLGFTAGGLLVHQRPGLRSGDVPRRLALGCGVMAVSSVLALLVAAHLPLERSIVSSPGQFACFVVLVAGFLVPFFAGGSVVSLALAAYGRDASRLYFADLMGSGLGCACSVVAMDHLGGGAAGVLVSGLAASLAALAFVNRSTLPRARSRSLLGALTMGIVALIGLARDPLRQPFYLPNAKLFPRVPHSAIISRTCSSLACVDLFRNPFHLGVWGIAGSYHGPLPEQIGVVIDAWALTSILESARPDGGPAEIRHPVFEALPPSLVHQLHRATHRTPDRALVIGSGGGVDVRAALHFGVRHVDAVDINPIITGAVAGAYSHYAGDLYRRPDVRVTVTEGRHYLRRSRDVYDLIQISGVDTFAASQAGAFALSENYLYTVEAFREYMQHLAPGGTLTLTRWLYTPPRQTLRLCVIADAAFRQLGLGDIAQRMVVIGAPVPGSDLQFSVVLVRRTPFSVEELRLLRSFADWNRFSVVYSPDGRSEANAFSRYLGSADRDAFVRAYPFRIDATTDDEPFFFEHNRVSRLLQSRDSIFGAASGQLVLLTTLLLVLAIGALFGLTTRLFGKTSAWAVASRAKSSRAWPLYFVALGLGYIAVEMAFVPRFAFFLGHPVYALSVVLFVMLVASGIGSWLSARIIGRRVRRTALAASIVAVLIMIERAGLESVFNAALHWDFPARIMVTVALVGIPSLLMGMLLPSGLQHAPAGDARGEWIARAWVLNGYASVVSSVGSMVIAMAGGFSLLLAIAAALYCVAAVAALRSRPAGIT